MAIETYADQQAPTPELYASSAPGPPVPASTAIGPRGWDEPHLLRRAPQRLAGSRSCERVAGAHTPTWPRQSSIRIL